MQQPPDQGWPQQLQQPQVRWQQSYTPYPPQQEYPPQQPYPPQQGQWQQPLTTNPQWSQQPYGQPPQPKKKSKLLIIIGVVVVLALFACVGAGVLANHGSNPNASTTTNSSTLNSATSDAKSTAVPTSKHYKQTDAVQVGNTFDVEIVSVKASTEGQIFQPQKVGDVFLVFVIKVKNISSQEQAVSSLLSFTLQDTNGQKYTETINPDAGATIDGKVEPGSLLQGSITYEVPSSIKNFTLAFQASLVDTGQVIWDINV